MKKFLFGLSLTVLLPLMATSSFNWFSKKEQIEPSKNIITKTFKLKNAPTTIIASRFAQVTIKPLETKDAKPYIELHTHENLMQHSTPEEKDFVLTLGIHPNIDFSNLKTLEYTLHTHIDNIITNLEAKKHSHIIFNENFTSNTLNIEVKKHAQITLPTIRAKEKIKIETNKHGIAVIAKLEAPQVSIKANKFGIITFENIESKKLDISASKHAVITGSVDVDKLMILKKINSFATINISGTVNGEKISRTTYLGKQK